MKLEYICFVAAAAAALTGMSFGIYMGVAHDFTLAPAHAHLNLLGWVTMCLYGLYHRGRARPVTRLAKVQVGTGIAGFVGMAGGLGVLLSTGNPVAFVVTLAGSFLAILSMALFLSVVAGDARAARENLETRGSRGREPAVLAAVGTVMPR